MLRARTSKLLVRDLGRLPYAEAFDVQRTVHADVVAGDATPTLLLVEHEPVITISRRKGAARHLLADEERLAQLGIDVQPTDRGGDITYHGPGQLVAYPIVRMKTLGLNVGRYMWLLEKIVIDTVAAFGVAGVREEGATGVWVRAKSEKRKTEGGTDGEVTSKIASIGVRISRGVSMHGLALNVRTNLSHFDTIVPCGLSGRRVTNLVELLGEATPAMADVKAALVNAARRRLNGIEITDERG